MSDTPSPVYVGKATATPFTSTLKSVEFAVTSRRNGGLSPTEQIEEAKAEAVKQGEQAGFQAGTARGRLEGFEEGKRLGFEEAKREADQAFSQELDQLVLDLDQMTERLQSEVKKWFEASEKEMAELAMKAVRKLLAAELEIGRESALEIVKEALHEVTHSRHIRIRVNPFDSVILRQHRQAILAASENLRDVEIVGDATILGGCVVESDGGVVDASLDTRLELLEEGLRRAA